MEKILFSPPDISDEEINEVVDTLKSGWITTGPKTKEFERQIANFCGTSKAVALNSATAALEATLRVLGIKEGDEVIVPAYTYTASASVISHVGAKTVMIDSLENNVEMDYDKLEDLITTNTKAIIGVDIAGIIANYTKIFEIVEKNKDKFIPNNDIQRKLGRIAVVADGAHSFGANQNGKMSGNVADFTTFSFHAVKNLTTAEGGAVTWKNIEDIDNKEIYDLYMLYSLHGQNKDALSKSKAGSWEYDIKITGYKCNMTDIMASIGLAQLRRYEELLRRRKEIISKYDEAFLKYSDVFKPLVHYTKEYNSTGHLYLLRINNIDEEKRNEIINKLAEKEIPTNVHYKPLPMMTAYQNLGFDIKDFPKAYNLYKNEITLPLHTLLTDEQVEYIINNVIEIVVGGK